MYESIYDISTKKGRRLGGLTPKIWYFFSGYRCRRLAGNGKTWYYPDAGAGGWQTTEKSTTKWECSLLRRWHSHFKM